MSQQAKKSTNAHAKHATATSEPILVIADIAKDMQETFEIGRENVKIVMRSADDMGNVAAEFREVSTLDASALLQSGKIVSQIFQKIGKEIKESNSRAFLELVEMAKESFACHTLDDVRALQNKAMHQMTNSYFDSTNKLRGLLFDSCNKVLEPLHNRTAMPAKRIRKTIAA